MALILADSDVLIDSLRGREPAASRVAQYLRAGVLATTAVTLFELQSGARTKREREKVEALLRALIILPFDENAALEAARVRRDLEGQGRPIGMADYLIAGTCLAQKAVLMTRNREHFARVDGLVLE